MLRLASRNPRDLALLAMSAYTLLRIGDILRLNVGDVLDADRQIVRRLVLVQEKSDRQVEIELPEDLREVLARYIRSRPEARRTDPLFIAQDRNPLTRGRRLSRQGAHEIFKKYERLAFGTEIKRLSTHIFCKLEIAEQYGLLAAQEALGHADLKTTQKYISREMAERKANEFRKNLDLLSGLGMQRHRFEDQR